MNAPKCLQTYFQLTKPVAHPFIFPKNIIFIFALFCMTTEVQALSSDKHAPAHIEADRVVMHEKDNLSIYHGNVKIIKGSVRLSGDKITIKNKAGKLHSIIILGNPATFSQQNDLGEAVSAQSQQMEYNGLSGMLELKEQAILIKNKSQFSSAHIIYDTQKDVVTAGQAEPAETSTSESPNIEPPAPARVQITIHPEKTEAKQP